MMTLIAACLGGLVAGAAVAFWVASVAARAGRRGMEVQLGEVRGELERFREQGERLREEKLGLVAENECLKEGVRQTEARLAEARQAAEERLEAQCREAEARLAEQRREMEVRLEAQRREAETRLAEQKREAAELLASEKREADERLAAQRREMGEVRQAMADQFRNLAGEVLEDKSRRFTETNRENIEKILLPLNKDIAEFRQKVDEAYHKEATERTVLERRIAELVQLNNQIRVDAANLTSALKGDTKTQGDWGEMILERILENSGLTKGREYFVQETLRDGGNRVLHNEEGGTMRPDVVVVYPDNRRVIIDSKVSLTAYVNYCNAETDGEREAALREHLLSMRRHVEELSGKGYDGWAEGTLDFVMMFVPNESSYVLAMQHDAGLWSDAYRKRVLLLSPANLIVSLKLTADLWSREYQNRNALEIAERGGKLYDKCVAFLESFVAIGDGLRKTQGVYEQALGRLKTGGGNLVSQTLKLRDLGIKSRKGGKEIPRALMPGEDGVGEGEESEVERTEGDGEK